MAAVKTRSRRRYPDTQAGHLRSLRDAFDDQLREHGHDIAWQRLRFSKTLVCNGTCGNCGGWVRLSVAEDGSVAIRFSAPDILRTRIRKSIRRCQGRG